MAGGAHSGLARMHYDATQWRFTRTLGRQPVLGDKLMLQSPDVRVLGRQWDRLALTLHLNDGIFGLPNS